MLKNVIGVSCPVLSSNLFFARCMRDASGLCTCGLISIHFMGHIRYVQYIQYIRYVQYCILMLGNLLWNGYSTVLYIQYHLYSKWGMQQPVLLRLLQGPVPLPNLISIFLFLCQRSAFGLQLDQQLHRDLFQLLADSRKLCSKCGQSWCHPKMIVFVSWMQPLQYCNSGIWCCTVLGTQKSRSHPTLQYGTTNAKDTQQYINMEQPWR